MVLHVGDEDHRPELVREPAERRQLFREAEPEHPLELVDHRGHPGALGDDHVVGRGVDVLLQETLGPLVGAGHRHSGGAGLRVGVPDQRTELLHQPPLDGRVEPAARRPVGVEQRPLAVRAGETVIHADDVRAELREELLEHQDSSGNARMDPAPSYTIAQPCVHGSRSHRPGPSESRRARFDGRLFRMRARSRPGRVSEDSRRHGRSLPSAPRARLRRRPRRPPLRPRVRDGPARLGRVSCSARPGWSPRRWARAPTGPASSPAPSSTTCGSRSRTRTWGDLRGRGLADAPGLARHLRGGPRRAGRARPGDRRGLLPGGGPADRPEHRSARARHLPGRPARHPRPPRGTGLDHRDRPGAPPALSPRADLGSPPGRVHRCPGDERGDPGDRGRRAACPRGAAPDRAGGRRRPGACRGGARHRRRAPAPGAHARSSAARVPADPGLGTAPHLDHHLRSRSPRHRSSSPRRNLHEAPAHSAAAVPRPARSRVRHHRSRPGRRAVEGGRRDPAASTARGCTRSRLWNEMYVYDRAR